MNKNFNTRNDEFENKCNHYYNELKNRIIIEYKNGLTDNAFVLIPGFLGLTGSNKNYKLVLINTILEKIIRTRIIEDINFTKDNIEIIPMMDETEVIEKCDKYNCEIKFKVSWIDEKERERLRQLEMKLDQLIVDEKYDDDDDDSEVD